MNKRVTIVIPCFNQGIYLADALASISSCNPHFAEILIVNDGSTDDATKSILADLSKKGYRIINQENQGLGAARNAGIRVATTDYILPLDADNKIIASFIERAVQILDKEPSYSVLYSNANYFGDKEGILKPGKFNLQRLMLGNYIDACAIIRRSALLEVGLYDKMEIMGYEDWDLWLKLAFASHGFYYLDETGFEYRVRKDSMMKDVNQNRDRQNEIETYFLEKYADKLDFPFVFDHVLYQIKKKPFLFFTHIFLKKYFPSYFARLTGKNKIRKHFIYD